jgi:type I restriction enzyme S subunit
LRENVARDGKLLFIKAVKLEDVIELQNGYAFKSQEFKSTGIPVVRITNVDNNGLILDSLVYYNEDTKLEKFLIKKGDILLALTGDDKTLKICMNHLEKPLYLNQRVAILRAKEKIDQQYLLYAMKKNSKALLSKAKGIAQKNISADDINTLEINLPSLTKQKEIAQTLDKASELIALRKASIEKLDELSQSIFIDMFGDPVENPKNYKEKTILKMGHVQTGNTPPRADIDNYGNFIEWIKSDNIFKNKLYMSEAKEYLSKKGYDKARLVPSNSLLFICIAGSMSSIGNLAITNKEVAFNQQINSLTPREDNVKYLYYLFKLTKKYFEESSTKSMKIMINKTTFQNLSFPIAPLAEQNKFAQTIEKIESQKSLYEAELIKLQAAFDALMAQSFEG